ncbi:hypothetical protein LCI18_003738 [Fusarium solani-melongenae]|uniref:Uncharacterized protein n=1 Tax=Fusarium solani subsp. cucurbitae TaxID=2747967 RepID=A0ACD3YVD0_FUSSC|nr:hypothetical protein LCI18_003738 [Fusarium solani-melongenae]
MTPTPSLSDARKLRNNTEPQPDQKTLDEIGRNNHGAAEGFSKSSSKTCLEMAQSMSTLARHDAISSPTYQKTRRSPTFGAPHTTSFSPVLLSTAGPRSGPLDLSFMPGTITTTILALHSSTSDPQRAAPIFDTYSRMSDAELGINPLLHLDDTGTCILVKEEGEPDQGPSKFYLDTIVSQSPICYRGRISTSAKPEFVVKLSWRSEARRSEESMLRLVKERKVCGVIQMYSHQKVDTISNLRRGLTFAAFEGGSANASKTRTTTFTNMTLNCLVVSPLGRPLGRFHSMKEFLRGFRDAIGGYRSLHLDGKVPHRDIPSHNIILAEVKREGEPWGVLIDLDLSMELAVGPARPGEIMGTKAFMAIDVMKRRQHTYRQNFESFLYVFLWIAICGGDRKLPSDSRLQRWLVGD